MDRFPVTRAQYLEFVKKNPEWRKSQIAAVFADPHYLSDWSSDLSIGNSAPADAPVTRISWFAANAYCESLGKNLPTVDQWEYVAEDAGRSTPLIRKIALDWYARPNESTIPSVNTSWINQYGVSGLFGLVWEWTLDFNSSMGGDESRNGGAQDNNLFCGSGSIGALDPTDYVSFMRYSFRKSVKASYTTQNLGFRCVEERKEEKKNGKQ
jgi:formylglycine-generating enzyme required for sulfatase activity